MGLIGVCFELSTTCAKCKKPLPLNGVAASFLCDGCRTTFETPQKTWESLLGDAIGEGLASEVGSGRNATIFSNANYSLMYGRQDPRCNPTCKTNFTEEQIRQGARTGSMACTKCGKQALVRPAPEFMKALHPKIVLLVGETAGAQVVTAEPGQVRFHCYHCGGSMPLDGKSRSVACTYCRNQVMVPDDIWVRMNPVRTVDRWYAVFDIDLSNTVGFVPEDAWDFADFCVEPSGNVIIAWEDRDEGDVGHRSRIALVNRDGGLVWKQDGIEFDDDARLYVSMGSSTVWLVSKSKGFAREIDPRTGQPIRTLESPPSDEADVLSVKNHDGFAIDWDGTFLVNRSWSNSEVECLRRFGPDGRRVPLWPGQRIKSGEDYEYVDWPDVPRKHPGRIPSSARMIIGWDGSFYLADDDGHYIAKYTRDGMLLGVMPLPNQVFGDIDTIQATRDGVLLVLFENELKIGDDKWNHVARIHPNGQLEIFLGAHVSDDRLVGQHDDRLKAMPDGTLFVGHDLDSIRGYAPNGQLFFATPATRRRTKDLHEELAKARRGKKLAADRGG